MNRSLHHYAAQLRSAISEDRTARAIALRRGMEATQPLTMSRLGELCELRERMHAAANNRRRAATQLRQAMEVIRPWALAHGKRRDPEPRP